MCVCVCVYESVRTYILYVHFHSSFNSMTIVQLSYCIVYWTIELYTIVCFSIVTLSAYIHTCTYVVVGLGCSVRVTMISTNIDQMCPL